MLPLKFISGPQSSLSNANQFYVFQSMPHLPAQFNLTYDASSGLTSVMLGGAAGMCGDAFERAKEEQESGSN